MSVDDYQYSMPLSDNHLREIGRVMAEAGVLEGVVQIAIWQVLNLPYRIGEQLTVSPSLGQLVKTLLAIVSKVFDSDLDNKEFTPIAQELNNAVALRNHIAHCYWAPGTEEARPLSLNFRNEKGEIAARIKDWIPSELHRVAARISRVGDELEWYLIARGVGSPQPPTRDWRPYQMPPEPKWEPLADRVLQSRPRSSPQ
jgi:hypothetical protein